MRRFEGRSDAAAALATRVDRAADEAQHRSLLQDAAKLVGGVAEIGEAVGRKAGTLIESGMHDVGTGMHPQLGAMR